MCPSAPTFFYLSNARQFHSSMGKQACYSKFMTKFIPLAWRLSTRHVITIYEVDSRLSRWIENSALNAHAVALLIKYLGFHPSKA